MGLLDKIKQDAAKSGQNKGKFIYFREGEKKRIRFLTDMEDGLEIEFHDSFEAGINVPCQEIFGRTCQYCGEEGLRTRSQYAWSVYDYEANEVKVFMFPMNNCSPLGAIAAMYENYGTLLDRDFVITVTGKQQNKTFSVVPMDKNKFRNDKAKPFSKSALLKLLDKAFPDEHADYRDDDDDDEDEIEETPKTKVKSKAKKEKEPEGDIPWTTPDEDDDDNVSEYDGKSAKELYKLCKERNIECEPKKPEAFYKNLLIEADEAEDDWGDDEDDDDDWED